MNGEVSPLIKYYTGVKKVSSLTELNGSIYYVAIEGADGIYVHAVDTNDHFCIYPCHGIVDIAKYCTSLVFTSATEHKVYECNIGDQRNVQVQAIAGSSCGYRDGPADTAQFKQPHGICTEGKTLFVTYPSSRRATMLSPLNGTRNVLEALGLLYDAFDVHVKHSPKSGIYKKLNKLDQFVQQHVENARDLQNITQMTTNGPQCTISALYYM